MERQFAIVIALGMITALAPAVAAGAQAGVDASAVTIDESSRSHEDRITRDAYLSHPFVSDVLGSSSLETIRAAHADDPGFVGAFPVATEDAHVALAYENEAPDRVVESLVAAEGVVEGLPVMVHENVPVEETIAEPRTEQTQPPALYGTTSTHLSATNTGIGPGQDMLIERNDGTFVCSSNFVYTDGSSFYLGTAGHCVLEADCDESTDKCWDEPRVEVCIDTCLGSAPLAIGNYVELGNVLYARKASDTGQSFGQDYAFVEIPTSLENEIRPTVPTWGGPTGELDKSSPPFLGPIFHYGQGVGLGDTIALERRAAVGIGNLGSGAAPGAWSALGWATGGDSGSGAVADNVRPSDAAVGGDAVGDITHSIVVVGAPLMLGTMSEQARDFTQNEVGTSLSLVT